MTAFIDLQSIYEVVEVYGSDAVTFLQGQLTCDISTLNTQVIWGAHCNIKGRVVAVFMLFQHAESFFLITSQGLAGKLIATLQRYVFRANVTLARADYCCYGLLQHTTAQCPESHYITRDASYIIALPGQRSLILMPQPPDTISDNSNTWQQTTIALAEPQLYLQTSAMFLPSELGLDALGGISLKKGCYIGQEIIARMYYLGKANKGVRQIMHQAKAQPGAALYQDTKVIGNLITSTPFNDGFISLASLNHEVRPPLYLDIAQQALVSLHST